MMDKGIRIPVMSRIILIKTRINGLDEVTTLVSGSCLSIATGRPRPDRSSRLDRLADRMMIAKATLTKINSNQDFLDITIHSLDLMKPLYRGVVVNRFFGKGV